MAFFRRVPELLPFFSKNQLKQNSGVQFLSDTARMESVWKVMKTMECHFRFYLSILRNYEYPDTVRG